MRVQAEAIALWKKWMFGLVLCGFAILIGAQLGLFSGKESSGSEVVKLGGLFVGVLAGFPYREMVPRKERLETYRFLLERFRTFDDLSSADQNALLSLANDALKETIKR